MAGLPWYRQWTEMSRHAKTRDLCARLKDRNAGMYVIRLQEHCAEFALDGRMSPAIIEDAAEWRGAPGELLAALDASGWLDLDGEARVLHGWVERNGAAIRKWQEDNEKPHGARKPRRSSGADPVVAPVETPPEPRSGFDREDVDLDRSSSKTPIPPSRWDLLRARLTPEQDAALTLERGLLLGAMPDLLPPAERRAQEQEIFDRLFRKWSDIVGGS